MTTKERILTAMQRLPDDASYDDAIERLRLLRSIEIGIAQADAGDVMDHDEFMAELDHESKTADRLDG